MSTVQLVNDWIRQNGLPIAMPWQGPKASVTFDSVRVQLHLVAGGAILLEARVCDLPESTNERERVVFQLGQIALGRVRNNAAALSVDHDGVAAWLQRRLPASTQMYELEDAIEALVNEIELWRAAL
jgi:hypothetical protein